MAYRHWPTIRRCSLKSRFLRQSVFGRLAGYEDVNDAKRLALDPVMRQIIGGRAVDQNAASASQMGRFETQVLATPDNLATLPDMPRRWIDRLYEVVPPKWITLDMDSSAARPMASRKAQPGTAISAARVIIRFSFSISMGSSNAMLQQRIAHLLKRPVGQPPNHVRRLYDEFEYQAGSWDRPRRVVAKVEWHPGELFPRVGFLVTNLPLEPEQVFGFYNQRGTAQQYIKEGKVALKWTRACRASPWPRLRSVCSAMPWLTTLVLSFKSPICLRRSPLGHLRACRRV